MSDPPGRPSEPKPSEQKPSGRSCVPMAKMIPNAELIASLLRRGDVHHCESCGQRMFVQSKSGLCPPCWNGRQPVDPGAPVQMDEELALAGILDETDIDLDILPA